MLEELKPYDEEISALDWMIVAIKSNPRLFSKPNADAVRFLENLLDKLRKQQNYNDDEVKTSFKPTPEQMAALRRAAYTNGNACFGDEFAKDKELHTLYQQLLEF